MKSNRLSGHELLWEGAAFTREGYRVRGGHWGGVGGVGHGRCSCGASSDELTSGSQRKRWHREHKDAIRALAVQP